MAFRKSSDRSGMAPSRAGSAASLVLHAEASAAILSRPPTRFDAGYPQNPPPVYPPRAVQYQAVADAIAAARVGLTRVGFVSDPNDKVN